MDPNSIPDEVIEPGELVSKEPYVWMVGSRPKPPTNGEQAPGAVRCKCKAGGYFGWTDPPLRVKDLTDLQTVHQLHCAPCPDGAVCLEEGKEFWHTELKGQHWQDRRMFLAAPYELSAHYWGIETCTHMIGATCPAGDWGNIQCLHGHEGPMCGVCDMGPDIMAPTHYRDAEGACVVCQDSQFSYIMLGTAIFVFCVGYVLAARYDMNKFATACVGKTSSCVCKVCKAVCCRCCWRKKKLKRSKKDQREAGEKKKSFIDQVRVKMKIVIGQSLSHPHTRGAHCS